MFHNKYQQYRLPFSLGGDLELKISVDEIGCETKLHSGHVCCDQAGDV